MHIAEQTNMSALLVRNLMLATSFAAVKARKKIIAKLWRLGGLGVLRGARTSRRKRGPVTLRLQLWLDLPLSQNVFSYDYESSQFWDVLIDVCFGSVAVGR